MPLLLAALAVLGWLAVGGLVYGVLSTRARLRQKKEELAAARKELQARSVALAEAEGEVERLKGIPKSELLPMLKLAHQQRSPLAAIQNALDMILQGYAKNDPQLQDEMLNLARDRAATMLERVNDFLRLGSVRQSEIERKRQPVQLLDVVQRLAPEQRVRAKWRAVDLHLDVPDSLPPVTATYEDMEHLLSNLVNNAIKYTNPGGKVTVLLREQNGHIVGTVEDTGIGIAPEDLPKIFGEFYRAESAKDMANGTGLGLAIVKRVVDLYDGHLHVESEPGKGSRFTFTFPQATMVKEEQKIRTFRDLQEEVVYKGACGKCGGCVSFCSASQFNVLELDEDGFPRYADEDKCLECGVCYLICPLIRDLEPEVRRRFNWKPPIGAYQTIISARAREQATLGATAGGLVTALLLYMLENYLIQGAVVLRKTSAFSREPLLVTTKEEIVAAADVHLGGLSGEYTTYSPAVSVVKGLESKQLSCVAVVGAPCQIKTVRKMQCLGISPAQVVGYTIGLFCMENLFFDVQGRKRLEARLHVDLADVDTLNLDEDLSVSLNDGAMVRVPFSEVSELICPACLTCTEFANDYADISVGGVGSSDGYATVLIRTEKGSRVCDGASRQGYIEEKKSAGPIEWRSERTKLLASVVASARHKQERGEARLGKLGTRTAMGTEAR